MIKYLKRKIKKRQLKRTFDEYGFDVKKFQTTNFGIVEYAQWLHPFEKPKLITDSNIKFYQRLSKNSSDGTCRWEKWVSIRYRTQ